MLFVGLTGGIGSGKSTVDRLLADHGAVIVDADVLARQAVEPGTPGFERVAERFGSAAVKDGDLDRAALADVVFADPVARKDLEGIVHPEVGRLLVETLDRHRETDDVVVFDAPLLMEGGFADAADVLIVVVAPREEQIARLIRDRGMAADEAEARIAAQSSTEEKVERADIVIDNSGSEAELRSKVDLVWRQLQDLAAARSA
ncbi:MAG: dephospho-CoA kinase [Actinobacteria bacterium]|nr:dephospho-CoA kinase [Actinomycetota bacterium]